MTTPTWTDLHLPEIDRDTAPAVRKLHAAAAARVKEVLDLREQLDGEIAQIDQQDLAEFDASNVAVTLRRQRIFILQDELKVRDELAALDEALRNDFARLAELAREHYEREVERIKTALVDLGYHCEAPGKQGAGINVPGWMGPREIEGNPAVATARERMEQLQARATDADTAATGVSFRSRNARAADAVRAQLQKIRERITREISTL